MNQNLGKGLIIVGGVLYISLKFIESKLKSKRLSELENERSRYILQSLVYDALLHEEIDENKKLKLELEELKSAK